MGQNGEGWVGQGRGWRRAGGEGKKRGGGHKKGQKEVERGKPHIAGAQERQAGLYTVSGDTHHIFPSDPMEPWAAQMALLGGERQARMSLTRVKQETARPWGQAG